MKEKYEAIWVDVAEDGGATIVFESYFDSGKLHVIYRQQNGSFMPYSFVRQKDHQWRLPVWCKENEKVLLSSLEEAKKYLESYSPSL